jgi:hypothetical protein
VERARTSRLAKLVAAIGILVTASAAFAFRIPLSPPPPYIIDGYLERAPKDATVIDRIEISAYHQPKRWLLVTSYRAPGEIGLDRYLSRVLVRPFMITGNPQDVSRILNAPAGTEIKGTFVVYTRSYPSLHIAQLESPA